MSIVLSIKFDKTRLDSSHSYPTYPQGSRLAQNNESILARVVRFLTHATRFSFAVYLCFLIIIKLLVNDDLLQQGFSTFFPFPRVMKQSTRTPNKQALN